jgi:uncharacterized 2Fe-2S/4Fe-4S cluster protein (DUF4445 family)
MNSTVHIRLHPQGVEFDLERGTPLQDVLFAHGVEFPCGGKGRCKGCRVRVLEGHLPVSREQERMLTAEEIRGGWRLSCQGTAEDDLTLELAQWEASILTDTSAFAFSAREGLGVAVDIGTTTVVAQLLDLTTANVLAVRTALNPQARFGADVMSRVSFALEDQGAARLTGLIRRLIDTMILELLEAAGASAERVCDVVLVGNTVMHHLFCGFSVEPLSQYPFESPTLGLVRLTADDLGWSLGTHPRICFLPCIGGYVGSDILAGVLALGLDRYDGLAALIDLGTNGEIVLGGRTGLITSSTAAGPAFEGARIYMGMRAATGAISEVQLRNGVPVYHVLGNVEPRGICGSGLVDAAATFLDLGLIQPGGRLDKGEPYLPLLAPVRISQTDIRELQLAKGAIAAGVRILSEHLGKAPDDVEIVHLAGAFGNYVNISSAVRIGLLPFAPERIAPAGNTALLGAKIALFSDDGRIEDLARTIRHVSLHAHAAFQDVYVEEMTFPASNS